MLEVISAISVLAVSIYFITRIDKEDKTTTQDSTVLTEKVTEEKINDSLSINDQKSFSLRERLNQISEQHRAKK